MSQETKDKVKAWLGTILFHALLVLALFFMALKTPLPLPDEEGVEVNMGSMDIGQGEEQTPPDRLQPAPQPNQEPIKEQVNEETQEPSKEEISTTENEEAPIISNIVEPKKETKEVKEEIKPPEPKPEPVVDQRLLYTGKKISNSEGDNQTSGNKGIETGLADSPNYSGPGGLGSEGISYNLGNRKASSLPKPIYNSDDQGRVKVRIRVDKEGRIISAEILQKGTTVSDIKLHTMAVQAALKSVFTPDANAPEIQVGTITYNFIKIN